MSTASADTTSASTTPNTTAASPSRPGAGAAQFLGYFSIGLGLAELLVPAAMERVIGVARPRSRNRATMQVMGLREIGAGLAILNGRDSAPAVWARVAGDVLDLALLGATVANRRNQRGRTLFAVGNVAAVTALDVVTARRLSQG